VVIGSLLAVVHVLHAEQVHVFFRASLPEARFAPGAESLEVALFAPKDIPWDDLAFRSTDYALRRYFEDKAAGREGHHFASLERHAPAPPKA
jgi:hypothetical protein